MFFWGKLMREMILKINEICSRYASSFLIALLKLLPISRLSLNNRSLLIEKIKEIPNFPSRFPYLIFYFNFLMFLQFFSSILYFFNSYFNLFSHKDPNWLGGFLNDGSSLSFLRMFLGFWDFGNLEIFGGSERSTLIRYCFFWELS